MLTAFPDELTLSASLENYLEAIHEIARTHKVVRVRDIARRLKVRMPSVHAALHRLSDARLVNHQRYESVELTRQGADYALRVARRHRTLNRFLSDVLSVSPRVAERDACRIEHVLSTETMQRLVAFMAHLDAHPSESHPWLAEFLNGIGDASLSEDTGC